MTSFRALLGLLLLSVGYTTAIRLTPSPVYARGQFKCDGKPLHGANVTLQVVNNDTGFRPPFNIPLGRDVVQSTVYRHPKPRPYVAVESLNSTTTDISGKYLLYGSVLFGKYGVETTIRLRIVHTCYVGMLMVRVTKIVDTKDLSDKDDVNKGRGPYVFEFNADLAHREWPIEEKHFD